MNRRLLLLPMAVAAVAVAGCGGGSNDSGGSSTSQPSAPPATTQASGGSATQTTSTSKTTTTKKADSGAAASAEGKKVFASAGCGSCHTLKAAGSNGNVGPNLDQMQPDQATVAAQVRSGGGGMPSFSGRLSSSQIDAVAAYVAKVAGK